MHQAKPGTTGRLIGFDLDDVLLEFFPVFAETLLRERGVDVRQVERTAWEYIRIPEIATAGVTESDVRRIVFQACHDVDAHSGVGPIDPTLPQIVSRLRRDKHRVVLATARAPTSAAVVASWLGRYGFVFDELRFGQDSKIGLDILIEDSAHQARRALETGSMLFMPDRPWNRQTDLRAHPNVVVYDRVEALYPLISARLQGIPDLYGFSSADMLVGEPEVAGASSLRPA